MVLDIVLAHRIGIAEIYPGIDLILPMLSYPGCTLVVLSSDVIVMLK